jgi:hypothetical protein
MEVKNKEMYHIHRNGIYDNIWKVGNEIIIDDNFNSCFCSNLDVPSGVRTSDGKICTLDYYIKTIINSINSKEKLLELKQLDEKEFINKGNYLVQVLRDTSIKLKNLSIKNREEALEEVRKEKFNNLPSRFHSIWLCDENSIDFWIKKLRKDSTIYKVLVTGEMFKSYDYLLPTDGKTKAEQKIEAKDYWNPKINEEKHKETTEYLFQGKVKVKKIINLNNIK